MGDGIHGKVVTCARWVVALLSLGLSGCARPPLTFVIDPGPDAGSRPDAQHTSACGAIRQLGGPIPPEVLLVLDKSGSMSNLPDGTTCSGGCGSSSKWAQVTTAIERVVGMTTTVQWGLKLFATSNMGCDVSDGVEVPIGPSNAAAITFTIAQAKLGSHTPTALAVNKGAAYLATLTDPRPKYLLLATDGLPNCNANDPGQTMADDSAGAEQAVASALAAGFPTFVIGVGDTKAEETLNQLALKGGVPQLGAATSFYQVSDTAGLVAALGRILGSVSCQFNLPQPENPFESLEDIAVLVNGVELPQDASHVNGWDYGTKMDQIQIYGPSCDALMAGTIGSVAVQLFCHD
jgi:hypothetical protein